MQLTDLTGSVSTNRINLRGKEVVVRALSVAESDAIRKAFPRPIAPVQPPRHKGSKAEAEPDEYDPDHQKRVTDWLIKCYRIEAAAGVGWVTASGLTFGTQGVVEIAKWAEAAIEEMASVLTDVEMGMIREAQAKASSGAIEQAVKN